MKLTYYNDFAFACNTKNGIFAINPSKQDVSLLFCAFTENDRNMALIGNLISWPGEYEFGGTAIQTFEMENGKLVVKCVVEDVRIVFLPELDTALTEVEMETLGNVDILVLEVPKVNPALKKMCEEIDPKALLPVGIEAGKFLAEMGAGNAESVSEFEFTASSLPIDKSVFVKLQET